MTEESVSSQAFAQAVIAAAGVAQTGAMVDVFVAVFEGEGTTAAWNPAATELKLPGSTDFNTAGVQNFESMAQGVKATAATLHDGHYGPVLVELGQGTDSVAAIRAWAESPWGTFHDAETGLPDPDRAESVLLTVQANRAAAYARPISGPGVVESAPVESAPTPPAPTPEPTPEPPAPPPAPTTGEITVNVPTLQEGSNGAAVKAVQSILNQKFNASPALAIDGDYGPKTAATVEVFQRGHLLESDSVVGAQTWGVLINY